MEGNFIGRISKWEPGPRHDEQEKGRTKEKGDRVVGFNTEDSVRNEGLARFDIIFYVRTRNGHSQVIINIEAQKSEPTDYWIVNRGIFTLAA